MADIVQKVIIDVEAQKANKEMKELTGTFDAFKKGMKSIGDLMGPFNQGFELAGKALRFAGAGLEAYAKTSKDAARDVRRLTDEYEYWKKTVLGKVGEVTVELGKAAFSIDQIQEAARRATGKGGFAEFSKAYADQNKEWRATTQAIEDAGKALFAFGKTQADTFGHITDTIAKNATKAMESAVAEARKLSEEYRKIGKALLGPGVMTESHRAGMTAEEEQDIQRANALYGVERDEADRNRRAVDYGAAKESLSAAGTALTDMQESLRQLQQGRQQTLFEAMLGPVEQIDLYKQSMEALGGTMSAFTDAVGAGYAAIVTGSEPIGQAMKKAAAASILATGTASAVDAVRETALGFGSLAWGPIGGVAAAAHFKSAALHAAVAVGAGITANALGAGGTSGAPSGDHRTAADPRAGGGTVTGGGTGQRGSGGPSNTIVVYSDLFVDGSPGVRRRMAKKVLSRASGGNDWEDS